MTFVSVVVPTYYRNNRLKWAVESALASSHEPVEVVVVDGSGEAHAEPVVDGFDDRVRYVAQDRDEGPHAARSAGAQLAEGDYVNFLDDDDRFRPAKLERQLERFDDDTGVVYCAAKWENGHVIRPDPDIRGAVLEYALRFRMTPSSPSAMLIDSSVLGEMLPLQNTHGADDMGMKIELAARTEFDFVDEPLVVKGESDDSLGGSRENVAGRFKLIDRYADLYTEFPPEVRRDALAHTYLLDADARLDAHAWSPRAIASAARACWHAPGWPASFLGYFGASLFGRPGRALGRAVYDRYVLGDEHQGKVT